MIVISETMQALEVIGLVETMLSRCRPSVAMQVIVISVAMQALEVIVISMA